MKSICLRVAVPWSLSHYIPLDSFHPLYRALFDHAPEGINLYAWDNARLHERFKRDIKLRSTINEAAQACDAEMKGISSSFILKQQKFFPASNQALTTALPGDIEFYHTIPFPSFTRPFVLHCESFARIFFLFDERDNGGELDGGKFKDEDAFRKHFQAIFKNPLCLGIFSHISETLADFNRFFSDPEIDQKLFQSRVGLSSNAYQKDEFEKESTLTRPKFLFIHSPHQNPAGFFQKGGHIALRFWKAFRESGHDGLLIMACAKPCDEDLLDYGVDTFFLNVEKGKSVLWVQDHLKTHEMNALMAGAHFFLLPSLSIHLASVMQAMASGTIPVITDALGNDRYVTDDKDGIVLKGVREMVRRENTNTGILMNRYRHLPALDDTLVQQLTLIIPAILQKPERYIKMKEQTLLRSGNQFSGDDFGVDFWASVFNLYSNFKKSSSFVSPASNLVGQSLMDCTLKKDDWARVFEGPTQPLKRIYSGESTVWELNGSFIHAYGNPSMKTHDWSVFAPYFNSEAPALTFSNHLFELEGKYLSACASPETRPPSKTVGKISQWMRPFPKIRFFVAKVLTIFRSQRKFLSQYCRFLRFKFNRTKTAPNIETLCHAFWHFHIVRFFHRYYAIRWTEEPFSLEKMKAREYSLCLSSGSMQRLLQKIRKANGRKESMRDNDGSSGTSWSEKV